WHPPVLRWCRISPYTGWVLYHKTNARTMFGDDEALARHRKDVGDGVGAAAARNVLHDLACRIVSRNAADAAARMRAGAAHVQTGNGAAVIAVPEHRPRREQLIERKAPVHDVAADEPEYAFEIERA